MPRIPLIASRDALDADAQVVFDQIVESRGEVSRPFEVLLHAPGLAKKIAELGHVIRFQSYLSDADRELVTLATGRAQGCAFVWESHLEAAREAGVDPDQIAGRQRLLASFVDELCSEGAVSRETFDAVVELVGTEGVVEVIVTVGYYTMLSYAMRACEAC